MNILYVTPSFYPAVHFGGPIFANLGLCRELARTGAVNLKVHTTDVAGYRIGQSVNSHEAAKIKCLYDVQYCRRIAGHSISMELLQLLKERIQWANLVHLSEVFSFATLPTLFTANVLDKPIVWSPHGALQRWKGTSKHLLKQCWVHLCRAVMDSKRCCFHVTSHAEKVDSKKVFKDTCYEVIPHGVDIPEIVIPRRSSCNGASTLMFIGRIHPIKGLENLLMALAQIRDINFRLNICGTGDDGYVNRIRKLCNTLGLDNRVHLRGHVDGREKYEAFMSADVCVVPSHTESFGIVVAEALAHGVPVIASTGTPWSAIEKLRCGIWTPNDPTSLSKAIEKICTMDLPAMGANGRRWMRRDFSWEKISKKMLALYERKAKVAYL